MNMTKITDLWDGLWLNREIESYEEFWHGILMIANDRACKITCKFKVLVFCEWPFDNYEENIWDVSAEPRSIFFVSSGVQCIIFLVLSTKRTQSSSIPKDRAASALQNCMFKPSPTAFWVWTFRICWTAVMYGNLKRLGRLDFLFRVRDILLQF